jgi:hypothetical protein
MACETTRELLLGLDWNAADRGRVLQALRHLEQCEACRAAVEDFDRLRAAMKPAAPAAEPMGGWGAFERRIANSLVTHRSRAWWMPGALAASLLLAVVGWTLYLQHAAPTGASGDRSVTASSDRRPGPIRFSEREIAERVQVFRGVSEVFDGQTSWVLVGDQEPELGLAPAALAPQRRVLLLRLTVSRDGDVLSQADLVIVPGQTAQLRVPFEHGQELHYRVGTSSEQPTRLSLWVDVRSGEGVGKTLAALATELRVEPGEVFAAGQFVTASGGYEVTAAFSEADLPGTPS